jgi:hypothetical protein
LLIGYDLPEALAVRGPAVLFVVIVRRGAYTTAIGVADDISAHVAGGEPGGGSDGGA